MAIDKLKHLKGRSLDKLKSEQIAKLISSHYKGQLELLNIQDNQYANLNHEVADELIKMLMKGESVDAKEVEEALYRILVKIRDTISQEGR